MFAINSYRCPQTSLAFSAKASLALWVIKAAFEKHSFFLPVAFLARSASFLANLFVLASDSAQAAITELDEIFISLFGLRAF